MTSKRETVLSALMAQLSASTATVLRNAVLAEDVPPQGLLILRDGDPGQAEVDLSPPVWHYEHRADLEVFVQGDNGLEAAFDALLSSVGALLAADRTLGGLCDWAEAEAPAPVDLPLQGAIPIKAANVVIVLHYSTTDPLN